MGPPSIWEVLGLEALMNRATRDDDVEAATRLADLFNAHSETAESRSVVPDYFQLVLMEDAAYAGAVRVVSWLVASCAGRLLPNYGEAEVPLIRTRFCEGNECSLATGAPKLMTPLHAAASSGHVRMVRALLDLNADIEQLDYKGDSALTRLLRRCDTTYICSLIEPTAPRAKYRDFRDYELSCMCLLLHPFYPFDSSDCPLRHDASPRSRD